MSDGWGWYLYGITRRGWIPPDNLVLGSEAAVRTLEVDALAAVVRAVHLSEFDASVVEAISADAARLGAMAQTHNDVVAAVQRDQAILPVKFGAVYASSDSLLDALAKRQPALLHQLERLEGCDEWAIHVYANPEAIEKRATEEDADIRLLRHDIAASSPGRAYFLERKLSDAIAAAHHRALWELGQEVYDRLSARANDALVASSRGEEARTEDETEVLRAAFLVARTQIETFLQELVSFATGTDGVRTVHTGPWPPYSFASMEEEHMQ
jgi:hypothetical protein